MIRQMRNAKRTAVLLTGTELRHDFFRVAVALDPALQILATFREQKPTLLDTLAIQAGCGHVARLHGEERQRSEHDFFGAFVRLAPDLSQPATIDHGAINSDPQLRQRLAKLNPDVLICYGTSIIREPVLSDFEGRFLNIHLGLSPYYRGGGTNFWPLVNGEPEFVGVTFMHIDAGVDTGQIVHQMRATIFPEDSIHSIGNRLIQDMALEAPKVARHLQELPSTRQTDIVLRAIEERVYRRKDFNDDAVSQAKENINGGMFADYLSGKIERDARVPIIRSERFFT